MKRKGRINAPKYTRLDSTHKPIAPHDKGASPVLLKEYRDAVHQKLTELESLTILETLDYVPTLRRYVQTELDRWYIIYEASIETSVFQKTVMHIGEIKFGFGNTHVYSFEEVARNYEAVIKKISLHNQMLQMMASADFPGKKVE